MCIHSLKHYIFITIIISNIIQDANVYYILAGFKMMATYGNPALFTAAQPYYTAHPDHPSLLRLPPR